MQKTNPLPGLLINGILAGVPAIVEAVKAKKEKKALAAAEAVAKAANGQLTGALLGAAAINAPGEIIPELPPEIIDAPLWMQGLWIGLATSGIVLRIIAQVMKAKAQKEGAKN